MQQLLLALVVDLKVSALKPDNKRLCAQHVEVMRAVDEISQREIKLNIRLLILAGEKRPGSTFGRPFAHHTPPNTPSWIRQIGTEK